MSYTALYRKWRPQTFSEVKGQDAIITTLRNQIKLGRVGHAYLFCGSRGTGKTSVAKIFARAVNCENPIDGEPCGTCPMCRAALSGSSLNVFELDAASNNSVENVRELLSEIQYPPTDGRYRVYIVDEVHMFSTSAFNAFLKTLEEPPEYVIFILATTEPHKIPATIISRCQQYDFRRIDGSTIRGRLEELCKGEGISPEGRALDYIARKADGGMRDAISLLDQASASVTGQLTYDAVLTALGAVDQEIFSSIINKIADGDAPGVLALIDEIVMSGKELGQLAADLAWYLRNLLLTKSGIGGDGIIDVTDEDRKRLSHDAERFSVEEIMRLISLYSECQNAMRQATGKRVLFEMTTLRALHPEYQPDLEGVMARIGKLEETVKSGVKVAAEPTFVPEPTFAAKPEIAKPAAAPEPAFAPEPEVAEEPTFAPEPTLAPQPAATSDGTFSWDEVIMQTSPILRNALKKAQCELKGEILELSFAEQFDLDGAKRFGAAEQLPSIIKEKYGLDVTLVGKVKKNSAQAGQPAGSNISDKVSSIFKDIDIEIR